ncbi:polysaccharide pyruvyl transferase family protein, partial [Colwellia sp. BRX8-8]|nr:polysaccharide pyruvyl transferase family protein [Colwellia sp. BRX8-8]
LITQLYAQTGEPITLIEFNGHGSLGDWKINNNIIARLNKTVPVTIEKYQADPIKLLEKLGTYKAIVSMRLHGSILGYLANTPVLSVNYHSKCKGWCEEIGLAQDYQIDLFNLNIKSIVNQIVKGLSTNFIPPTLSVDSALKNSLSNWSDQNEKYKIYCNYSAV